MNTIQAAGFMPAEYQVPIYQPSDDESYMNEKQLAYFKQKIIRTQSLLFEKLKKVKSEIRRSESQRADLVDRSDVNSAKEMKIQTCQQYQFMIERNEAALQRIEKGTYGFCQITGDRIGLKRLELIPDTNLSVEGQRMIEEKMH